MWDIVRDNDWHDINSIVLEWTIILGGISEFASNWPSALAIILTSYFSL